MKQRMLQFMDDLTVFYGRHGAITRLRSMLSNRDTATQNGFPQDIPLDWAHQYLPELQLIDGSSRTTYIGNIMLLALRGSDREIAVKHRIAASMNLTNLASVEEQIGKFKFDVPFIGLLALIAVLRKQFTDQHSMDVIADNEALKMAFDSLETLKNILIEFVASGANSELHYRAFVLQLIDDIVNPQLVKLPSELALSRPAEQLAARDRARRPAHLAKGSSKKELTIQVCRNWLLNQCNFGQNCKYPHMCLVCPHGTAHRPNECKKFKIKNQLYTKNVVDKLRAELAALKAAAGEPSDSKSSKSKSKK